MDEHPDFEDVHTIDDWYDGPRAGFAQYHGTPHHFRSLYHDYDDWDADEDRFELVPVSSDVLSAALEASAIFARWDIARKRGEIVWTTDSPEFEFGALPEERDRFAEVRSAIARYAAPDHPDGFIVRGKFDAGRKRVRWRESS